MDQSFPNWHDIPAFALQRNPDRWLASVHFPFLLHLICSIANVSEQTHKHADLLTHLRVLILALLKLYAITNCAQSRSAESLLTRFAACPHTNCCVKSRWRLIRITPVDVSALRRTVCTGKHGPAFAAAAAIKANLNLPLVLKWHRWFLMGKGFVSVTVGCN